MNAVHEKFDTVDYDGLYSTCPPELHTERNTNHSGNIHLVVGDVEVCTVTILGMLKLNLPS